MGSRTPGDRGEASSTEVHAQPDHRADPALSGCRTFELTVLDGPHAGLRWRSTTNRASIGSHASNDLVLAEDRAVSRFHCELRVDGQGARLLDRGSRNGTSLDGTRIVDAFARSGALIAIGRTAIRFELGHEQAQLPLSPHSSFGSLIGASTAMRAIFAVLERVAPTDATLLIEGETGTGKELCAESVHLASNRQRGPFVVVDCAGLPPDLLESELFGHERGAFTGAHARRVGAFEEASGGTVFLDEIGELPADLQPKLLRVLARRQVRRVGSNSFEPIDVRVIAATNRDLRVEVNERRFRPDLYFRLAVVQVALPPLRARAGDVPLLAACILDKLGADPASTAALTAPDFLERLASASWPGNVRELANHLERCLVLRQPVPVHGPFAPDEPDLHELPFAEARRRTLERFERRYLEGLLKSHGGRVLEAASAARVDRVHLYRLLRRHELNQKKR